MRKLLLFLFLIFISHLQAQINPGAEWSYQDDPFENGWDESQVRQFYRYLVDSTYVTGYVIIHQGKIAFEYGDLVENSYIASCRKSVLSMLYGQYVEDGTIDLNKTVADLGIDDVEGLLPREKQASIQDIISARSGVYHPEGYPGGMQQYAPDRGSVEPGSYWLYSNWDFNVAGYIFEQETGKNIYDEVERKLAIPLHMQDWKRSLQNKQGDTTISRYLAYPMWFSTRDMARIGQLMLNRGRWNGKQIIPENWVQEMLKQRTTSDELNSNVPVFKDTGVHFGYGYMWWLWEKTEDPRFAGAYSARGAMGQNITVFPAIDVVVAFKTKAAYRRRNSTTVRLELLKRVPLMYQADK
jgi:CubicO group peptidase (beta-lactamase class C family)